MNGSRRALASLAAATLLLAACDPGAQPGKQATDWAAIGQRDLNCLHNDKATVISKVRHDMDNDDKAEWFVTFSCGAGQPAQLEVFAGDTDPAGSRRIERLTRNNESASRLLNLDAGCVYFAGNRVIIRGHRFAEAETTVTRVVTWNGGKFETEPDKASSTVTFPDCA